VTTRKPPPEVTAYLSAQGKRGGAVTSEAKATAARENGKKGGRPKKTMRWWECDCPECGASHALPDPPFPATTTCPDCGKTWNVQKMRAAGYVALQQDRVPS
jgi:ssDNA-binding Zn-finger/Zn-ribbon topoisomerase 1